MDFKATPKSIEDVLRLQRKYIIPRFQREFSWEQEELSEIYNDLLDNITFLNNKLIPTEYFIGSLVLVGDDDNTTNIERYVVDGQQRITTFTIIFSVLTRLFEKENKTTLSEMTHQYIIDFDNDGNQYAKLINENPKPFFQERIQKKVPDLSITPKSNEEKRLLAAYNYFERQLKESILLKELYERNPEMEQISYIDALKAFRDQILSCKVIYVTVSSMNDAYTIFEVLNAKGKDLSAIDIIKNSIMSVLKEEVPLDSTLEKWNNMKSILSNCSIDLDIFYRHYWVSKYCLSTTRKLVSYFDSYIPKNTTDYEEFVNDLFKSAQDYAKIVKPSPEDWKQPEDLEIFSALEAFNTFSITQVRIFILALFNAKQRNVISHKNYKKIMIYLEYFHFVFTAVCSSRASGLERRYASYARKLRSCTEKTKSSSYINMLITDLKESLPSYGDFEAKFISINYTSENEKQKRLVQYILKRLERYYNTNELKPNSFTIEHILPESSKNSYVGFIGNLLPLGEKLNNELKDKDFITKITKYKESNYVTVKTFVKEYEKKSEWTTDFIENRTKIIARILYDNDFL